MDPYKTECLISYLRNLALNEPQTPNLSRSPKMAKQMMQHSFSERLFNKHQEMERCSFSERLFNKHQEMERCSQDSHSFAGCHEEQGELPPVSVVFSATAGRFLRATKDIEAGETIFWEPPIIFAPKGGTGPTCLECFLLLPESNWPVCKICRGPKCSTSCDGYGRHELECHILASIFDKQDLDKSLTLVRKLNIILTPLRTYLAIQENNYVKDIVEALQSNADKRRLAPIGKFIEEFIVKVFKTETNLNMSSDFIHHVCGVFDTNAFDANFGDKKQARALLPVAALMNHTCTPNTQHWFLMGHCIIRATVPIKKGEAITNAYTQTLLGTKSRQNHLSLTKHFICNCCRCEDPTELGTHLSSILCQKCKKGLHVPAASVHDPWMCNLCGDKMCPSVALTIIKLTSTVVSQAKSMEIDLIKISMKNVRNMLGKQHYVYLELELSYINDVMESLLKAKDEDLFEVLARVPSIMDVMNKVEPGFSRIRGMLLLDKLRASAELLRRYVEEDDDITTTSSTSGISILLSSLADLEREGEECEHILKWDPKIPDAQRVRQQLSKLMKSTQLIKPLHCGNPLKNKTRVQ